MEYVSLIFYSLFLCLFVFLALYNFAYVKRVGSSSRKIGFLLPELLRKILKINTIVSFIITAIIAVLSLNALLALNIPTV